MNTLSNSLVLHEIMTGQWCMSHSGLLQLGHIMQSVVANDASGRPSPDRKDQVLSFLNEDMERINPRDIAEIPKGSIAVVNCVGAIMRYGSWYTLGANEVVAQLDFANNLENVAIIILVVDGPGGSTGAITPFLNFALRKRKPVIGLVDNSLSMHKWIPDTICDYQIAENNITSRIGSIGVLSTWTDAKKYYEAMGVVEHVVYPDESKHKNEISRMMEEDEQKAKEILKNSILKPLALKFQSAVKKAHPNLIEEEGVLTGRTFAAEDAKRVHLIDDIGNMELAVTIGHVLLENRKYKQ